MHQWVVISVVKVEDLLVVLHFCGLEVAFLVVLVTFRINYKPVLQEI